MAQTKVKLISDGVIVQGNLHSSHGITTAHIGEGSNLYYTDARVSSYLSTNSFATESYVGTQITNLVDSSPATLNTLNELAAALGDDPNFATTTATNIGLKAPLASPTFTGNATFAGDITFGDSHFIGDDASDNLLIQSSAGENIIINSLDETLFRINGSTKMQIGSSGIMYIMGATASKNNSLQLQYNSTAGTAEIYSKSTGGNTSFEFYTSDGGVTSKKLSIANDGTSTLEGHLYLKAAANQGQLFFGTNNDYEIFGGGMWGYLGFTSPTYYRFFSNGTDIARITTDGITLGDGSQRNITGPTNQSLGLFARPNNASEGIIFSTDGGTTTEMFIQDGGRVNIGPVNSDLPSALNIVPTNNYDSTGTGGRATGGILIRGGTTGDQNNTGGIGFAFGTGTAGISGYQNGSDADRVGLKFFTHGSGTGSAASALSMIIKSGGEVGIGTASPGYKLDVSDEIRMVGGLNMTAQTGTLYATDGALSYYSAGNGVYLNGAGASGWLRLQASGVENDQNSINIYGSAGNYMNFRTANSTRMIINSAGNVGIRTTSPKASLDVDGDINTTGHLANTLEFSTYFGSGTTVIATLNGNFESGTTAVASIEYVGLYAYAGGDNTLGIIMASTRRSSNNTAWSNVNDETVHVAGSTSKEPTLYWDNGLLKITVGSSVQISCRVRITYHGSNTGLTRNHSA